MTLHHKSNLGLFWDAHYESASRARDGEAGAVDSATVQHSGGGGEEVYIPIVFR